jgi:hypothetical protein
VAIQHEEGRMKLGGFPAVRALVPLIGLWQSLEAVEFRVVEIGGDWRVNESVAFQDTHLKVRGNVYIAAHDRIRAT